jgi:hypothetical protein
MGDDMEDIVDGSFDTPEGPKVFARRRPGESAEHFAMRALAILQLDDGDIGDLPQEE